MLNDIIILGFIMNIILLLVLVYFIYNNRRLMNQLRKDMHSYMEKDISNLNKVIESTMFNDRLINDKTNFIMDVLEEDAQIRVVNKEDVAISLSNIENEVSLPDSNEWLKNITSVPEFRKLLSAS